MVLDASLLYTQHYNVWIKGKRNNPGKGVAPSPPHLDVVAIEKGAFRSPSTTVGQFTYLLTNITKKQSSWDLNKIGQYLH